MQDNLVTLEIFENSTAIIKLNRPQQMNALSNDLMMQLKSVVQKIKETKTVKVAIITGNEKVFAAGIDVKAIQNMNSTEAMHCDFINKDWFALETLAIPTIAAVSGYALGGGFELALMCDILVADETAKFGFPEITLGLMPGMGGTQKLPRLINSKIAFKKIILGETFDATKARNYGLIDDIATPDAITAALEIAQKISKLPLESLWSIKKAIKTVDIPEDKMQFEREMFRGLFDSPNKKIGVDAFVNKQQAKFIP